MDLDLTVSLARLTFPNPLVVAAGPPTSSPRRILECFEHGAGGVVTKTITFDQVQQSQPRPRMLVVNRGATFPSGYYSFYSTDLMSEYPPEKWVDLLGTTRSMMRRAGLDGVLITSLAGRSLDEWARLARMAEQAGADAVELNLSCPLVERGALMGRAAANDVQAVREIVRSIKESTSLPVAGKLTPHGANPEVLAGAMVSVGIDMFVSTARFQGLMVDTETLRPVLWGGYGGYGGPWQVPISLSWTAHIAKMDLGVPIIGSGGISSGADVARFVLVGADAVQACTSITLSGYAAIPSMLGELRDWMTSRGFGKLTEFKGLVLTNIVSLEDLSREKAFQVLVDRERCTGCAACVRTCPYYALTLDDFRKAHVDHEKCDNCGLCISLCPFDALGLARRSDETNSLR